MQIKVIIETFAPRSYVLMSISSLVKDIPFIHGEWGPQFICPFWRIDLRIIQHECTTVERVVIGLRVIQEGIVKHT